MGNIVLCADSETLRRPWMLGVQDAPLDSLEWLKRFSDAQQARDFIAAGSAIQEIWVASSDDVEAVNLVAAIRKDRSEIPIVLILSEITGSSLSRANAAGATHIFTSREFAERFNLERRSRDYANNADGQMYCRNAKELPSDVHQGNPHAASASVCEGLSPKSIIPDTAAPTQVAMCSNPADDRHPNSFVMSIVSGSGGSGKSLVSACVASLSASRGVKTILLDCDLQFGDLKILMGNMHAVTIDDVIADPIQVLKLAQETRDGVALIAAPQRLEASEILGKHIGVVIDECTKYFDNVIINTGSAWTETHAVLLERSNSVLFLIDQRASSVYAAQHAVELCQRLGMAMGNFSYCLNRCCKNALFNGLDIACVLNGAQIFELKEGGVDPEELSGAGCVDALLASKNEFVSSIKELTDLLLPEPGVTKRRPRTHIKADPMDDEFSKRSHRPFLRRRKNNRRRDFRSNSKKHKSVNMFARLEVSAV